MAEPIRDAMNWWPFPIPQPKLPDAGAFKPLADALASYAERLYWAGVVHGALTAAVVLLLAYVLLELKHGQRQ